MDDSATNSRPSGPYVGFELHLAVQTRDVRWTDGIERTALGAEVAGVVTTFSLVPAGINCESGLMPPMWMASKNFSLTCSGAS